MVLGRSNLLVKLHREQDSRLKFSVLLQQPSRSYASFRLVSHFNDSLRHWCVIVTCIGSIIGVSLHSLTVGGGSSWYRGSVLVGLVKHALFELYERTYSHCKRSPSKSTVSPWFLLRDKSLQSHSTLVQLPTAPQKSLCKWSASSGSDGYRSGVSARQLEACVGALT